MYVCVYIHTHILIHSILTNFWYMYSHSANVHSLVFLYLLFLYLYLFISSVAFELCLCVFCTHYMWYVQSLYLYTNVLYTYVQFNTYIHTQ